MTCSKHVENYKYIERNLCVKLDNYQESFFFVYRHSDFDGSCSNGTETRHMNLVVACEPQRVTRSDTGLHDLKHLREVIVERMMRVLRWSGPRVVSLSPRFRGGV